MNKEGLKLTPTSIIIMGGRIEYGAKSVREKIQEDLDLEYKRFDKKHYAENGENVVLYVKTDLEDI